MAGKTGLFKDSMALAIGDGANRGGQRAERAGRQPEGGQDSF